MKLNSNILAIILLVVGLGGGFFAGMQYQKSQRGTGNFNRQFQGNRQGGQNGQNRLAGRPVMGDIISMDDKSITVKMQDGSSKIVILPDSVTVSKTDTASKADLKVGIKVGVFGMDNSDGTVTAQNIQLNPMFRGFGANQGTPSGSPR